jgi:hypothetical protein
MGLEIKPEPTPEEREAILRVLAELERDDRPSPWWEAGVRDAVDGDSETED